MAPAKLKICKKQQQQLYHMNPNKPKVQKSGNFPIDPYQLGNS